MVSFNFFSQTISSYHQIAVGRGKFGDRFKYSKDKRSCNPNCKFGCSVISSVHHFFFDCSYCLDDILNLQDICARKRIAYDLKNLFTQPCLQIRVELFLKKIIDFWFTCFLFVLFCLLFFVYLLVWVRSPYRSLLNKKQVNQKSISRADLPTP